MTLAESGIGRFHAAFVAIGVLAILGACAAAIGFSRDVRGSAMDGRSTGTVCETRCGQHDLESTGVKS